MNYLITYDLNKPGQDYTDLIEAIKKNRNIHPMKSVWFIKSDKKVDDIFNALKPFLDENDRLIVTEMNANNQGWLSNTDWEFLKKP